MDFSIFAVNDEPYCLWEANFSERTKTFLDGLDADYFEYVLQAHTNTEDEKRALVAIKLSLHHATETMFSLLGSFVQAPDCPYAWIAKCSNTELREFTSRVNKEDDSLITKLNLASISWTAIAGAIFATYMPGTLRQKNTIKCFANLWSTLNAELLNPVHTDEYNALKHGFRARAGSGFAIAIGIEREYGVSPPASEMQTLGKSNFGATFLKIEALSHISGSRHIRSRQISVNWSLERIVLLHQLVYMSIKNVVSALKIVNNYSPSTCLFVRPENDSDFLRPWTFTTGVTSINIDYDIDQNLLPAWTKAQLLTKLRANKAGGI